jgi:hypothetical protein
LAMKSRAAVRAYQNYRNASLEIAEIPSRPDGGLAVAWQWEAMLAGKAWIFSRDLFSESVLGICSRDPFSGSARWRPATARPKRGPRSALGGSSLSWGAPFVDPPYLAGRSSAPCRRSRRSRRLGPSPNGSLVTGVAIPAARRCGHACPPACHKAKPNFQASRGPSRAARKASRGRHRGVTVIPLSRNLWQTAH